MASNPNDSVIPTSISWEILTRLLEHVFYFLQNYFARDRALGAEGHISQLDAINLYMDGAKGIPLDGIVCTSQEDTHTLHI